MWGLWLAVCRFMVPAAGCNIGAGIRKGLGVGIKRSWCHSLVLSCPFGSFLMNLRSKVCGFRARFEGLGKFSLLEDCGL